MDNEERVQVLEGEFKLLKSEIKQTLSSVRDFLLDIKLPTIVEAEPTPIRQSSANMDKSSSTPAQEEAVNQSPDGGGDGNGSGNGNDGGDDFGGPDRAYSEPEPNMAPTIENNESEISGSVEAQHERASAEDDLGDVDAEDTGISSGDMPSDKTTEGEQQDMSEENLPAPAPAAYAPTAPQINMLANLIRWAAEAMREIGLTQLPVFLDVYATSGHLAEEMKENILHLAEVASDSVTDEAAAGSGKVINEQLSICMEIGSFNGEVPAEIRTKIRRLSELILQQTAYSNKADIWSQMLLKLHGILTNGGYPVQPVNFNKNTAKEEPLAEGEAVEESPVENSGVELGGNDVDESMAEEDSLSEVSAEIEEEDEEILPSVKNSRPAKLRLVLPVGDGAEQELDLGSLFITTDSKKQGNGHKKLSTPKR